MRSYLVDTFVCDVFHFVVLEISIQCKLLCNVDCVYVVLIVCDKSLKNQRNATLNSLMLSQYIRGVGVQVLIASLKKSSKCTTLY